MIIFACIAVWLLLGYVHSGYYWGYFNQTFNLKLIERYGSTKATAIATTLGGPLSLFATYACGFTSAKWESPWTAK